MVVNGAGSTDFSEELTPRNLRREALRLATRHMKLVNQGGATSDLCVLPVKNYLADFFC